MAKAYCIIPEIAKKLLTAAKEGHVVGNIEQLYEMTSKQRRDAFSEIVGATDAKEINLAFEKAMASNQQKALAKWAEKTFTPAQKKDGTQKTVFAKIDALKEQGLLTPEKTDAFLEDVVADKIGLSITPEQAAKLVELSNKLQEAAKLPQTPFGPHIDYWKAKRKLDNYTDSLNPTPALKVFTSIIGRATMLFSIKSPIVNIESNTINAITEAFGKRIETLGRTGIITKKTPALAYIKYVNDVYNQSGYDVSRMYGFDSGRKSLGEEIIHSQGKGIMRKIGRFYTDIVFNKLMTAPDVLFASMHFADSATLYANVTARLEGLRGKALQERVNELFLDATKIEPKSLEAQAIREKARLDAEQGTYTDKNNYSQTALALRGVLNKASGDLRLGDNLMPFVQVPATVVGRSIEYSGVILPLETLITLKTALNAKSRGDSAAFRTAFGSRYLRKVIRAGIGTTVAFIISSWFKPDEFIGEYPTTQKERALFQADKRIENSVLIGGKWISLDYFGPLSAPFVGMMNAKKYGTDWKSTFFRYSTTAAVQASRIPGFKEFTDLYAAINETTNVAKGEEDILNGSKRFAVDFLRARTIPAIVSDLGKGIDPFQREVNKDDLMGRLISRLPVLRNSLPEKKDVFGESIKEEGFWSSVLFGSRVKTKNDQRLITELSRLEKQGQLPSITDVRKTSPQAKELKEKIGEKKFTEFYGYYGSQLKTALIRVVNRPVYSRLDAEEQKKLIEKEKNRQFDRALKKYGYHPKKATKKSSPFTVSF